MKIYIVPVLFVVIALFASAFPPDVLAEHTDGNGDLSLSNDWEINDLIKTASSGGSLTVKRDGGDPYIIFTPFQEAVCWNGAVRMVLQFTPVIKKRFLAELFWNSSTTGFGEANKVFFFLYPPESGNSIDITIPIPDCAGYDRVRFDLPRDFNGEITVSHFTVVDLASPIKTSKVVDSFRALSSGGSEEIATVVIPYLIKTLGHGFRRLTRDKVFLFVWLGGILGLLFMIRRLGKLLGRRER